MPVFSAAYRAALLAGAKPVPILVAEWPSGTVRYSVAARGIGGYPLEPRLIGGQAVTSAIPIKPGGLSFPEASISLADTDGEISRLIEAGADPRGSTWTMLRAIPGLAEVDWFTLFSGVFDRAQDGDGGFSQDISLVANQTPLRGNGDKSQFLKAEFPLAPATTWGRFIPRVYGTHSAENLHGKGMVEAICHTYDATEPTGERYRYTPTMGIAAGIPRVYADGVIQALTTDYVITYPIRGGKQLTSIDFTDAHAPGPDIVVTCDIEGLEDVGDGSGDTIVNPVAQWRHDLANFCFGDYRRGAWNDPEDYPIDLATFAESEAFADAFAFLGSMRFGGGTEAPKITDRMQRWLSTWLCFRPFWTEQGKLAIRPLDHRFFGYTSPGRPSEVDAVFLRGRAHEVGVSFNQADDTSNLVRRLDLTYLHGLDADGKSSKAFSSISLEDVSQPDDVSESYDLEFAPAELT